MQEEGMQRDHQKIPSTKKYEAILQPVEECCWLHAGLQISVITQMPNSTLHLNVRIVFITCNQITEEFPSVCWTCKKTVSAMQN